MWRESKYRKTKNIKGSQLIINQTIKGQKVLDRGVCIDIYFCVNFCTLSSHSKLDYLLVLKHSMLSEQNSHYLN